jgi:hypothetical protein
MPSRHQIRAFHMALERSRRGLQLWFRPCRDRTLQSGVMAVQSSNSPVETISGLHFGSPGNLCHLDVVSTVSCRGEPLTGGEATAPSIIKEIEKVQGGEQAPRNGSLALPKRRAADNTVGSKVVAYS